MKEISNRSTVIIIPKCPFKEWATVHNEISDEDLEQRLKEIHAYLIEWSSGEKQDNILKPYYRKIFEYELMSWNSIISEWPLNRNYELFLDWFEFKLADYLFDLETEAIEFE